MMELVLYLLFKCSYEFKESILVFSEAAIVARGCSTKDKVFYRECETHSYGANLEKMCFCSFDNCNPATALLLKYAAKASNWYNISCLIIVIAIGLLLSNYQCSISSLNLKISDKNNLIYFRWNPWPSNKYRSQLPNEIRRSIIKGFRMWIVCITSQLILHCPKKLLKRYYTYYIHFIKCVQNSSVVNIGNYLIRGTIPSLIFFTAVFCKVNPVSRFKSYCLLVIKDENFPYVKVRKVLLAFHERLYSLGFRKVNSTVDINEDCIMPK